MGRGLEFVTSDGELIAADGTLIVGPRQAATGMLSRRSELRACHEQANESRTAASRTSGRRIRNWTGALAAGGTGRVVGRRVYDRGRQTSGLPSEGNGIGRALGSDRRRTASDWRTTCAATDERVGARKRKSKRSGRERTAATTTAKELEVALRASRENGRDASAAARRTAGRGDRADESPRPDASSAWRCCGTRWSKLERSQQEREQMLAETRQQLLAEKRKSRSSTDAMLTGRQTLAEIVSDARSSTRRQLAKQAAADDELRRGRAASDRQSTRAAAAADALQAQQHKLEVATTRCATSGKRSASECRMTTGSIWKERQAAASRCVIAG